MMLVRNIRPRRFSHTFIYIDERRERINAIERRAASGQPSDGATQRSERKADGCHALDGAWRRGMWRSRQPQNALLVAALAAIILFVAMLGVLFYC